MEEHDHEHEHGGGRDLDPARFLRSLCVLSWLSVAGIAWKPQAADLVGLSSLLIGFLALGAAPVAARMALHRGSGRRSTLLQAAGAMTAGAAVAAIFAVARFSS